MGLADWVLEVSVLLAVAIVLITAQLAASWFGRTAGLLSGLLLALQQHIQQENQVFTTVSNVMRAKHDTAKAAVSNVRA